MKRAKILQQLMIGMNKILPKRNLIIFNSYPAYSDNSFALYEYIMKSREDITQQYEILWGQKPEEAIPAHLAKYPIKAFDKKTIGGIWKFLTAKYVFTSHGYFPGVESGNGQVQINLWHGCGYKSMTEADSIYRGDMSPVTGTVYVPIHAREFHMQPGTVFPTGLPRNDTLFHHHNALVRLGIPVDSYTRIDIWMPTYRKAKEGHDETDGEVDAFTISSMQKQELLRLNEILARKQELLIVKPHPMDAKTFENIHGFSNLMTITNEMLQKAGVQLYELLPETSALLSDYSSVVIDYLLLQKPVVMVMSDVEDYRNTRGFVFEDLEAHVPGPMITNLDGLLDYFEHSEIIDGQWKNQRDHLTHLFHDHIDDRSCERVCDLIFGKKDLKTK